MTRRLLLALAQGSLVNPVDYGAECDVRGVYDAAVAGGALSTVTSASAAFTSGDTGKTYYLASTSGAVTTGTLTYVNSTTATMSAAAGGAMSGARLIWGTDDTAAWQDALGAALPGQCVMIPDPDFRTLCVGNLTVPTNVKLGVMGLGPFDPQSNPAWNTWGPTFVVGQNSTAFITLDTGSGVGDFIFYSANQVPPTATTPIALGAFIAIPAGKAGCRIGSPYMANAYVGIDVRGGRHEIDRPQIGALAVGMSIDQSLDVVDVECLTIHPFWRICEGMSYTPTAGSLDEYALTNAKGVVIYRSDSFDFGRIFTFGMYTGVALVDSPDTGLSLRGGYGMIGRLDVDLCAYGIAAQSTQVAACLVGVAMFAANGTGVGTAGASAVITQAGGTLTPAVVVGTWSHRGSWAGGATSNGAGTLRVPATNPG